MKHEFDTPALRQTAEEIQGAVRAKSITADMVGGTLLALVNATGEIIETFGGIGNSITVKAKCKALINITEWEEEVAQGATVYVDMFAIGIGSTRNFPTQVLTADENGEVVFTVPCGYGYAVYSKYDGYRGKNPVHPVCPVRNTGSKSRRGFSQPPWKEKPGSGKTL